MVVMVCPIQNFSTDMLQKVQERKKHKKVLQKQLDYIYEDSINYLSFPSYHFLTYTAREKKLYF